MITIVTIPLVFTRASTFSVTPVFTLLIVLANSELPCDCAPVTACALNVGTDWPTLIEAGMLSVATTVGAEITFALLLATCTFTVANNWRERPTRIPPVNVVLPPTRLPSNCCGMLAVEAFDELVVVPAVVVTPELKRPLAVLAALPVPPVVPVVVAAPLPTFCKYALTPLANDPVRSTS